MFANMHSILGTAYILAAFLKTGYCLRCNYCKETSGVNCAPQKVICEEYEVCLSTFKTIVDSVQEKKSVEKRCGLRKDCGQSFSLIQESQRVTIFSSCCDTDDCTPLTPSVLPNGRECPSCYTVGNQPCQSMGTTKCTGNEDTCYEFYFPGSNQLYPFYTRGCTTRGLCNGIKGTIVPIIFQTGQAWCSANNKDDFGANGVNGHGVNGHGVNGHSAPLRKLELSLLLSTLIALIALNVVLI
ncbi:uncharacterized protein O3C94_014166 [Discoglossus pictus]